MFANLNLLPSWGVDSLPSGEESTKPVRFVCSAKPRREPTPPSEDERTDPARKICSQKRSEIPAAQVPAIEVLSPRSPRTGQIDEDTTLRIRFLWR